MDAVSSNADEILAVEVETPRWIVGLHQDHEMLSHLEGMEGLHAWEGKPGPRIRLRATRELGGLSEPAHDGTRPK